MMRSSKCGVLYLLKYSSNPSVFTRGSVHVKLRHWTIIILLRAHVQPLNSRLSHARLQQAMKETPRYRRQRIPSELTSSQPNQNPNDASQHRTPVSFLGCDLRHPSVAIIEQRSTVAPTVAGRPRSRWRGRGCRTAGCGYNYGNRNDAVA